MVSMRSGQPGINSNQLSSFILPIPSLKEQTAIAQALSDAEAYITSLEKLIEKKRQIQQGAKQELLKPKDGWEIKSLGDIGKTFGGLSGKSKDDFNEGVYPYIPFMNIMSNPIIDIEYFDYVNLNSGESQNLAIKGDLFFNGSSETPEEVGMCSVLLNDIPNLYLNSFCFGFRIKSELKLNGLYLSYYFRSKEGRKLFYSMAQGATRYNLSKSNFNKLKIPIPTIEEQNEIAERLFDLDSDIKIHEVKLSKAKSIKQGMMQNLLTGKIRLI
jgi:type I restriction enzyme S subunit